jgi:hypothetical protein
LDTLCIQKGTACQVRSKMAINRKRFQSKFVLEGWCLYDFGMQIADCELQKLVIFDFQSAI